MIDLLKAKEAFKKYISNYDIQEPKIQIKIIHMYQVSENARKIAKAINLPEKEQDLAELIGLLHDIGRFEQVRLYHTFSDKISVDHAQKGVEVLLENNLIRNFVQDSENDDIIYLAIRNHNKCEIEDHLSERERLHCQIIRDADNIDLFRAVLDPNQKLEDFGHIGTQDIAKEILSPEFFENFKKQKVLKYVEAKSDMDIMVAIIAHIYTLNFKISLQMIKEADSIRRFVTRINSQDSDTREKLEEIVKIAMHYMNERLEGKEE